MREAVGELLRQIPGIWRGRGVGRDACAAPVESTGYAGLDALLPGGGWPVGALTELVSLAEGIGELRLLAPALRSVCDDGRPVALVRPPHVPYAPALARMGLSLSQVWWIEPAREEQAHWAAEQILREGSAGAVLLWTRSSSTTALRRLQLAAGEGGALAFAYRPYASLRSTSPAALRLVLHPAARALHVEVVKARGGRAGASALCPLQAAA